MRIIDKCIIREMLGPFIFGVCAFSSVFIGGGTLFRIAQYISKYGASIKVVIQLFLYNIPSVIMWTFPMSVLLATLMCFGRLSGCGELTAMRAAGQSFYRLALPVFITAFSIFVFSVVFNETVVPSATAAYNRLVFYEIEHNTKLKSQEHLVLLNKNQGAVNRLTYATKYDENTRSMLDVTVQEFENNIPVRVQTAQRAVWEDGRWVFYSGIMQDLSGDGSIHALHFDQQEVPVEKNEFANNASEPEEMTIKQLKQTIQVLPGNSQEKRRYEVELHQRLSIPAACLVFALIGSPLGVTSQRVSSSNGLGISVLVIFLYYIIMTGSTVAAQNGAISPVLAAWLPNIAGGAIGLRLILKAAA
ncbi:MAG TPA: LptF/LptG family permease [Methylomusa anaerophila]|uniref:Putative permease YjgP/YjgQ family protein n=1 Tax=Methylomusa anaerophila TaxID=1930071 RepID=A0A348ALD3_9FIRM|nr:LptF/LptG family permease [Methylomusa anaerophila]BBB91881.1 putative permease YjgP/YjgQ family protein [Methylomusa anaerophila]HML88388.1 LptF/LptG family permease [Methylomusa anaerophila]